MDLAAEVAGQLSPVDLERRHLRPVQKALFVFLWLCALASLRDDFGFFAIVFSATLAAR